jgi:hypothetical protein
LAVDSQQLSRIKIELGALLGWPCPPQRREKRSQALHSGTEYTYIDCAAIILK